MNECHFIGRFVHDPELREVPRSDGGSTHVVNFRLAVPRSFKTSNGLGKQTNLLDFEVWDTAAEFVADNFRRGDTIIITHASARNEMYEDDDTGKKFNRIRFRVEHFEFPAWRNKDREEVEA